MPIMAHLNLTEMLCILIIYLFGLLHGALSGNTADCFSILLSSWGKGRSCLACSRWPLACSSYHGDGVSQWSQTAKGGSSLPSDTEEVIRSHQESLILDYFGGDKSDNTETGT